MVSNSDIVILASIGGVGGGTIAYHCWENAFNNMAKYLKYSKRIEYLNDKNALITPDAVGAEFAGMTDEEKRTGKEMMVMGYALTFRSWLMLDQGLLSISPELGSYAMSLPNEIMKSDLFYEQSIFGIGEENKDYRMTYGYKFAMQHTGGKTLFVEPFIQTKMLGFPEFYHKKRTSWVERVGDLFSFFTSTDPFQTYSFSSIVLFEGDYVAAFGLVNYQLSTDTFTMTKPIAIIKGGLDTLQNYFKQKASEKFSKAASLSIFAGIFTAAAIVGFIAGRSYYSKMKENRRGVQRQNIEVESLTCIYCNDNKVSISFNPCNHILYGKECYDLLKERGDLENCTSGHVPIEGTDKVYQ